MSRPGDPLSDEPTFGDRPDWPDESSGAISGTTAEAGLFDLDAGAPASGDSHNDAGGGRLKKSATAFRTISEVADELHVPQHVLRFWETRFPQVKPLKRGGGRRYYRPDDVGLLRRIADLLYIQGYTIKGVQRLLRDGDGTLQGDLPPPEVADQDGDEPVGVVQEQRPAAPLRARPESAGTAATSMSPASPAPRVASAVSLAGPGSLAGEIGRLRAALGMVLAELESLRRQLPV
ncbi:MerR family transcriptional regulator [Lichenicoccus roseus]|uniref:MerR family transcriptional regulator n=1 Tax=Lichenicoccus roseus TaxID=2683649 RepID=UPI00267F1382